MQKQCQPVPSTLIYFLHNFIIKKFIQANIAKSASCPHCFCTHRPDKPSSPITTFFDYTATGLKVHYPGRAHLSTRLPTHHTQMTIYTARCVTVLEDTMRRPGPWLSSTNNKWMRALWPTSSQRQAGGIVNHWRLQWARYNEDIVTTI